MIPRRKIERIRKTMQSIRDLTENIMNSKIECDDKDLQDIIDNILEDVSIINSKAKNTLGKIDIIKKYFYAKN